MKLVAVSTVKNEADIIEAFVRHTQAWVDFHLVFDHDSTDGTREILGSLVTEGAQLALFTGNSLAKLQQDRCNYLMRKAFSEYEADWTLLLDADEILVAPNPAALRSALAVAAPESPVQLLLRDYAPTTSDANEVPNPVLRLRYRRPGLGHTAKVFVPRALGTQPEIILGSGNHQLLRGGNPLPAHALPDVWLAHFPLRSPQQQALRVLTAELQKLSHGRAYFGLDVHYRLGFQLLAENPRRFFATVLPSAIGLHLDPAPYAGTPLRYTPVADELVRFARAFVPYLERLANSHGRLVDQLNSAEQPGQERILPLATAAIETSLLPEQGAFAGFMPLTGWQPQEGPVPEAFLPPFHWATGPETCLRITSTKAYEARLAAEALTYSSGQHTIVQLNGTVIQEFDFPRVNQKENWRFPLALQAGDNELVFVHAHWLESAADPRKLALIFLSLQIE